MFHPLFNIYFVYLVFEAQSTEKKHFVVKQTLKLNFKYY